MVLIIICVLLVLIAKGFTMTVQLEIDEGKLAQLFEQGVLCAADFRCLNMLSKKQVTQICLKNCIKSYQAQSVVINLKSS